MEVWRWCSGVILNHASHLLYSGRLSQSSLELPDMASLISQRALETPTSIFWGCNYRFMGFLKDLDSGPHACCSKHVHHGTIYPDSPPYFLEPKACQLGYAGWPGTPRVLSISTSQVLWFLLLTNIPSCQKFIYCISVCACVCARRS